MTYFSFSFKKNEMGRKMSRPDAMTAVEFEEVKKIVDESFFLNNLGGGGDLLGLPPSPKKS